MLDMFTNASLRWPLTIAIMMMLAQQLSGINAAMFYSTSIFTSAGLNRSTAVWATIAMGIVNVMQTIASVWLVDHPRFGRRALMMTGMVGMWLSLVGLFVSLKLFVSDFVIQTT
jgi:SP family facilitated glucose transporter-like MFS transporter 1